MPLSATQCLEPGTASSGTPASTGQPQPVAPADLLSLSYKIGGPPPISHTAAGDSKTPTTEVLVHTAALASRTLTPSGRDPRRRGARTHGGSLRSPVTSRDRVLSLCHAEVGVTAALPTGGTATPEASATWSLARRRASSLPPDPRPSLSPPPSGSAGQRAHAQPVRPGTAAL